MHQTIRDLIRTCGGVGIVALLALTSVAPAEDLPAVRSTDSSPHGQYVEARTASVFAGACHYNGERVTDGRSAILSWKIESGSFGDENLAGVRVVAAVHCDDNLAEKSAARQSEFVVDADTDARAAAAVEWIESKCASQLGTVANIRRAPITFIQDSDGYRVQAIHFAALSVRPMPDRACCLQPNLVWYQPVMGLQDRRVGYSKTVECNATQIGDSWQRADENDAFYGKF